MNEVINPRILEALEADGLDTTQVVLEESDVEETGSLWSSIWTVRLPECMVFLWDFWNNGNIEVYAKTTHDGLCYPISSCVSCMEVVAQQQKEKPSMENIAGISYLIGVLVVVIGFYLLLHKVGDI